MTRQAFEHIAHELRPRLKDIGRRFFGDEDRAEDIAQETLMRLWFRAHLVDAVTHTPISRSRYVYVELHDQRADTLVQRLIVKCDSDGVFANALVLPHDMHGGSYTLAAYTQWMRNFPAERFFYKELLVVGNTSLPSTESDPYGLRTGVRTKKRAATYPIEQGH